MQIYQNLLKLIHLKAVCPERFFNVGIAEQNLISVGAGLAAAGKPHLYLPLLCLQLVVHLNKFVMLYAIQNLM